MSDAGERIARPRGMDVRSFVEDPRRHWMIVGAVLFVALILRVHFAWEWNQAQPPGIERLRGDERSFDGLARDILVGAPLSWPGRVPVYPALLAVIHRLSGFSYAALTYVQAALGVLTVALTYVLARWRFGSAAGLIALVMATLSYVLIRHSVQVLSEPLYAPVVLFFVIVLYRAVEQGRTRRYLEAGAVLGLTNLVRPTLLLFPAMVAALFGLMRVPRGARRWAQLTVAMVLVLAPWQIFTTIRYGVVLPLATSNGILWQGSPEYYHLLRTHGYTYLDVWERVLYDPDDAAPDPGTVEGESYWRARAIQSIRAEPLTYVRYALEKTVTYWIGDPDADWAGSFIFDPKPLRELGFSRFATVQLLLARAFPLLALVAAILLWRRRRELYPIYAVLLYATALHAATHAEARLSEPFQPLLIVIVSAAVVHVVRPSLLRVRAERPAPVPMDGSSALDARAS